MLCTRQWRIIKHLINFSFSTDLFNILTDYLLLDNSNSVTFPFAMKVTFLLQSSRPYICYGYHVILKFVFQFSIPFSYHPPCVIQHHLLVYGVTEQTFSVFRTNADVIAPGSGIIVSWQTNRPIIGDVRAERSQLQIDVIYILFLLR